LAIRLDYLTPSFEEQFAAFLTTKREVSEDVNAAVRAIIDDVRTRGDAALADYTRKFDGLDFAVIGMAVTPQEIDAAIAMVPSEVLGALKVAAVRIEAHHARQRPKDDIYEDSMGVGLGSRWTAIDAVGLYVPGGTASYPSSVLMNALPAKVAGVERIVMVVPANGGVINPAVLAAARMAGVEEIYRIGGAQAIAALAYGTATIAPVAKIMGPGNAYVAAAKRQVFGTVGIDMIAGPSEVLVIADDTADAEFVAADLLAQAEHSADAQAILVTTSRALAEATLDQLDAQMQRLGRESTLRESINHARLFLVESLEAAFELSNAYAPEHLIAQVSKARDWLPHIRNAGSVFLGAWTPETMGDYCSGTNHVLPTYGFARAYSGLSLVDFQKRMTVQELSADGLRDLGPTAITIAGLEGLDAHANAVQVRLRQLATSS
jgi:histidinol dehydrogenase